MEHGGNAALKQVSHTSGKCQSFALAVGISSSLVRRWDSMLLINLWSDVILHVSFCMRNKNTKNVFVNSFVILDAKCCKNWIYLHVWEKWRALGKGWICPLPEQGPAVCQGSVLCHLSFWRIRILKPSSPVWVCSFLLWQDKAIINVVLQCEGKWCEVLYVYVSHTVCCRKIMMKEFFIPKGIKPILDDVCGCPVCKLSLFFFPVCK